MRILFFSPHSAYDVHSLPEAVVAESFQKTGHDVTYVTCNQLYSSFCLCFSQLNFQDFKQKSNICRRCTQMRDAILDEFGFPNLSIDNFITDADRRLCERLIGAHKPNNFSSLSVDNVPIGKFSLYEFILNHKLKSVSIPSELIHEYLAILQNSILTYFASTQLLRTIDPERVITYNSLYSVNRVVSAVADQHDIPHFTLHAGAHHKKRLQQITIFKGIRAPALVNQNAMVDISRKSPCTLSQIELVSSHVSELFKASSPWVYSIASKRISSTRIRSIIGASPDQKVVLAVMRSCDERFAAQLVGVDIFKNSPLFQTQIEWCDWLIQFAKHHPHIFFVFRVHPREFPNKRESVKSQNATELLNYFQDLETPSNFYINLPSQNISLHDLLKVSGVVLNNSSSAGLEASLFGIPVIGIGDDLFSFDPYLQIEPCSLLEYEQLILRSVDEGLDYMRVILAFRWLRYVLDYVPIDISDGYTSDHDLGLSARLTKYLLRLLGRLGLMIKSSRLRSVLFRAPTLLEKKWLHYAIVNNCDSHIGVKPLPSGSHVHERDLIKSIYSAYMHSISCDSDQAFLRRISSVFP